MGFIVPAAIAAEGLFAGLFGGAAAAGTAASVAGAGAAGLDAAAGLGAASAASAGISLGTIGTALSAVGGLYGGVSAYNANKYQAKVLGMQAAQSARAVENASIAGSRKESMLKTEIARTIGAQRAAEAANGVDVDVGSAVDIADSTQLEGAADIATTHFQAMQEAYGYSQEAWNAQAGASAAKSAGRNALIGSVFDAGGTFLSGASSLAKKRFANSAAGIGGKPSSINDILRASPSQRLAWGS